MTLESEQLMGQDHLAEHTKCQLLAGAGDAAQGRNRCGPCPHGAFEVETEPLI